MRGTRWRRTLREIAGLVHREARISLTPVVDPDRWVFLLGCYNSGTTLLSRMLSTLVGVSVLPKEGQFLTRELPADYELGLPRMWVLREDLFRLTENDPGPDPDPDRLKREWLMRFDRSQPVFVEKSPPDMARTRWLQHHFHNAHFIAIVRNGYAVAEGIRRKAEPLHLSGGWPIELCARQWRRSHEILLEDAEHLHRLLWIRYEELVESPEAELRRISEFLGLPSASIKLDPHRAWSVHEREDEIRNLNAESIGRLTCEEIEAISAEAGVMLEQMGYRLL